MPGFDGTGPMGAGPRTGGGFGYCLPIQASGIGPVYGLGRGGLPWGGGRGRGFGGGRGRGRRGGFMGAWPLSAGYGVAPAMPTAEQEKAVLRNHVELLGQQLQAMQARLSELESQAQGPSGT
ncbi:MAG: DUF5320 domain-containing protein [Phycisphaerae bacterium]|nr:DUF5320 domain-containing protein [Phycisphaerae bacterium]